MKIYIQTNNATANIFGLHTQPRKTTRYTNKLKLASGGGGGGGKRAQTFMSAWEEGTVSQPPPPLMLEGPALSRVSNSFDIMNCPFKLKRAPKRTNFEMINFASMT